MNSCHTLMNSVYLLQGNAQITMQIYHFPREIFVQ